MIKNDIQSLFHWESNQLILQHEME